MIKILIVLEEEDGIDFRAYSFQISNKPENLAPQLKLHQTGSNEEPSAGNATASSSASTGFDGSCRFPIPQVRRTLESTQIFMN